MIVNTHIGDSKYSITVEKGALEKLSSFEPVLNRDIVIVIVSKRVFSLHGNYIKENLKSIKKYKIIEMDDGEEFKSYTYANDFINKFIEIGATRHSLVVAIGGGVVGDFAGFVSSVYMRGIPVVQVPTTVLSMVDSSIGGKVAVNVAKGKNIVGTFHQPIAVFSDINFLKTLDDNDFRDGLVESLKHGYLGDKETLEIFKQSSFENMRSDEDLMQKLISQSVRFKTSVVERDEFEGGLRSILNFGHTTAHAIESLMNYKGITHGEAVAFGIVAAAHMSLNMDWIIRNDFESILNIIRDYSLIRVTLDLDSMDVVSHMKYDKKNSNGKINFVLVKGIYNPQYNVVVNDIILKDAVEYVIKFFA